MADAPKMDHSYDGIEEYDNPLPGWWKWLFVASIVISPLYWMFYHGGAPGRTVHDAYGVALAANTRLQFSEIGDLAINEETILRYTSESKKNWLRVGEIVFKTHCISCHGRDGEGKVGPNLTDNHYKNVQNIGSIGTVVQNGAAAGAMPAWGNRLHQNEIVLVASYVASLRGTMHEKGKAPEGREIPPWPEPPPEPKKQNEGDEGNESVETE